MICIDDGSTDKTAQEIQQFTESSPKSNIQLLRRENKGAPAARNKDTRHTKEAYFQFLDTDDQLLPQKIENQIKKAIKNNPFFLFINHRLIPS
jgi:glycosyltransferase involved in cell wall biosynthesis